MSEISFLRKLRYILGIKKKRKGENKVVKDAAMWVYNYSIKNGHILYVCIYKLAEGREGEKAIVFVLLEKMHY